MPSSLEFLLLQVTAPSPRSMKRRRVDVVVQRQAFENPQVRATACIGHGIKIENDQPRTLQKLAHILAPRTIPRAHS
jgi:hypothetical protein